MSSSTSPYATISNENSDTTNLSSTQQQQSIKPLAPHLRPSLAFPSSTVLSQAKFLLQQQQYDSEKRIANGLSDESIMSLPEKQWDTTSNGIKQTTTYIPQTLNTRSTAINADTLLTANIPLPDRFSPGSSTLYAENHPAKQQRALYRTSNHSYGQHPPSESELPKSYFGNAHEFTKTFNGGMYKNAGMYICICKFHNLALLKVDVALTILLHTNYIYPLYVPEKCLICISSISNINSKESNCW